jgi:hypothetical protein
MCARAQLWWWRGKMWKLCGELRTRKSLRCDVRKRAWAFWHVQPRMNVPHFAMEHCSGNQWDVIGNRYTVHTVLILKFTSKPAPARSHLSNPRSWGGNLTMRLEMLMVTAHNVPTLSSPGTRKLLLDSEDFQPQTRRHIPVVDAVRC